MKRILIAALSTVLLGSCGVYSSYKRPQNPPTDSLYQRSIVANADSANLGQMHWREVFTDPKLQSLIETALRRNTDLQTARLRIEQAQATLSAARLAFLPTFALAPQGTVRSIDHAKATQTYVLPLTASWQVDVFGSLRNAKKRSRALLEASKSYKQAVQVQLIGSVASAYYGLVLLDAQLKVSQETAGLWRENVRAMKAMMQAGSTNDAAVSSAEANLAQVEASVIALKQQIFEAENAIALVLAEVAPRIERNALSSWQAPASLGVGYPIALLSQRPDVMRAEQSLASAFYATNEARSAFYPQITLSGTAGWTNDLGVVTNPGKLLLSAVGQLVQPLFQGGKLRAGLKIAKSQQEEARLAFVQTLLDAGAEVNNRLSQVQSYRAQAQYYSDRTQALSRATKATKLLMESGSATYLEVLTAQQSLLSAQLAELSNQYQEIASTIALYQALGGGRTE